VKITISAEEIALAVRKNSHRCMIAEAIRRQVSHATRIIVDLQSIRWTDEVEGIRYFFFTPPAAQEALLAFDGGMEVKPFEFELRKPAQIRPQGVTANMEPARAKHSEQRVRRAAPVDSELPPTELHRRRATQHKQQIKLRDTEREFGICRVREHNLKSAK
jgi:hypothetical protein